MVKSISVDKISEHPVIKSIIENSMGETDLEKSTKIPYVIKDKILMSPGVWNGYQYSANEIKEAYERTDWDNKEIRSLYLDHLDGTSGRMGSLTWVGEVVNPRIDGENLIGDLVFVDKNTAMKLAYGAKMGISPKVHGEDEEGSMIDFFYDNFSVVINPAVKTAYINNSENEKSELDRVFSEYNDTVNMSYSELKKWSENECSKKASLDRSPISRNLHLLSTPKEEWGEKEIKWANKTIAFVARMKKVEQGEPVSKDCNYSKRDISLRNWAYNPNNKSLSSKGPGGHIPDGTGPHGSGQGAGKGKKDGAGKMVDAKEDVKKPYGDVSYADPGYRDDEARYPLDTEKHVRAAWSYINMPKNQKFYSKDQLDKIMDRIKQAAKRYDINISEENKELSQMGPIEKGTYIEQEHYDTYLSLVNYVNEHGELPSEKFLFEAIANDHLKHDEQYYDKLSQKNEEISVKNQEVITMAEEEEQKDKPVEETQETSPEGNTAPASEEVAPSEGETKAESGSEGEATSAESDQATNEMSDIVAILKDIQSKVSANSDAINEMKEKDMAKKKEDKEEMKEDKEETKKEDDKKEAKSEMSDKSQEIIHEMSEKIKVLESKLNEPAKATKKVAEMSQNQSKDANELFIKQLAGEC